MLQAIRSNRFFFRSVAIFMCLVLVIPTFAAGAPEAAKSLTAFWRRVSGDLPNPYSHAPRERPVRNNLRRDKDRSKWWTSETRQAYEQARAAANNGGTGGYLWQLVASLTPGMALAWGSGSTAGYPVPGEGAFPGGGSAKNNRLGAQGTVNSATSNLTIELPVVGFPTRGDLEVDLTLIHNSQNPNDGDFGPGWTHSFSTNVTGSGSNWFVEMPDGLVVPFTKSGSVYTGPVGFFGTLEDTMTGHKLTLRNQTEYVYTTYGAVGLLTAIRDRVGNQISLTWSSGQLQTVVAPDSRTLTFSYNGAGDIDQVDGPDSKTWTFGYNGSNQLTSVQFPEPTATNRLVTFDYDGNDNITEELDPEGESWTWTYSGDDCTGWQDPASSAPASATFSAITGGLEMQPSSGNPYEHIYSYGLLWLDVDPDSFFTEYVSYDGGVNMPEAILDKRGELWQYTYNAMGQVLTKQTPLGKVWTYTYTAKNDLDYIDSPVAGEYIDFQYNGNDLLETIEQSVDSGPTSREVIEFVYDGNGDIDQTLDALKRVTDYTVDSKGDITAVEPPDNADRFYIYDGYGRVTDTYDNAFNWTNLVYDETGWVVEKFNPDSSSVQFAYDNCGRRTDFYDELTRHQIWTYDESGRLASHTNGRGDVNQFNYNDLDLVAEHVNGNSNSVYYAYTGRGEMLALYHLDLSVETWVHDGNGNVTQTALDWTNSLDVVDYVFDSDNRMTDIDYPTDTDVSFDYDDANRRTEMIDGTGTTEWTYDLAGQVTLLETPQGDVAYTYNADGTRDEMEENGSAITEYSWDGTTGQLNWIKNQFNETTSYDYDPTLGHLVKKTMHDGQYEEYSYDSRYRLWLSQVVDSGTSVLHETEYVFNAASEVESTYIDSDQTDYVYDDASQLEQESRSGYTCDYTYDDNGNRLSKAISGGITETYNYDPEERLTSVTWNGGSNYKNFTYDDGGRVTAINNTGSTRTFTYDEESRLTAISGAYTASYEYNGLRTRVEKTEASVTRTFLRDGAGPTSPVLNDGAAAYTPGTSERRGGTTTYMHSGIKNADFQTNTSEVQTGERVYDAFGNLTASSGSFVGPFGYGGQFGYQEDGSGLKLLGNRYYDPSIGRFLTRDLIKDGTNWYAYCENNPVTSYDADGLKERALTDGEKVIVREAIAKIREAGLATEADDLTKMLDEGSITYDDELTTVALTPMLGKRRIILGRSFMWSYVSWINGGCRYSPNQLVVLEGKINNAGTLVHELTHVFQNIITSVGGNGEREAYGREVNFYEEWRRKRGGRPGLKPNIQGMIDEANSQGSKTFPWSAKD